MQQYYKQIDDLKQSDTNYKFNTILRGQQRFSGKYIW